MIQIDMLMPKCCDECFALDDHGDYPFCLISQDQRGYTFNVREKRMPTCPLKVQKSRMMTLEEAQTALHNDDVVWVELKDKIICGGIRMDGTDYFTMQNGDVLDATDFDSGEGAEMYGKEVRCWTSCPSEAQREAIPWN